MADVNWAGVDVELFTVRCVSILYVGFSALHKKHDTKKYVNNSTSTRASSLFIDHQESYYWPV
jgi:hypothetical protein